MIKTLWIITFQMSNFNKKLTRLQMVSPLKKLHSNNENDFYFEDS